MLAPHAIASAAGMDSPTASAVFTTWAKVREDFNLDQSHIQMAQMLLASHPTRVREAISKHRQAFDENPATYWEGKFMTIDGVATEAAGRYMNCDPGEIALTDSTTQGMSLLLNGFRLKKGEEILSTTHDHYITDMSIKYACAKRGTTNRRIAEYADPAKVSVDEVVDNITKAISKKTRVVVVTWVQSCTGVKLPVRAIADAIAKINNNRSAKTRVYFCVDGVHGFGNQADQIADLGCDFLAAGTHKWIFGPRGTGLVYARKDAWDFVEPTIPSFSEAPYSEWLGEELTREATFTETFSPGGFHAFEHRWSLNEAFEYQLDIGREHVHQRTTYLNSMLKEGITEMPHVKLHTPVDPDLSAGINCFEIEGYSELEALEAFHKKGIIASTSPYRISYARLTPCIINTEQEVETCLEVMQGFG